MLWQIKSNNRRFFLNFHTRILHYLYRTADIKKGKGTQFDDYIYKRRVSASRQLGVNNLPRFVTQPRPAGNRTRHLLIASPTPYNSATTPPHHATDIIVRHHDLNTRTTQLYSVSKTLSDFGHKILLKKNKLVNCRHISTFCNLLSVPL